MDVGRTEPFYVNVSSRRRRLVAAVSRSGLALCLPPFFTSVGIHNTEKYEEVLVILEGQGEMRITGGPTMDLKVNSVVYCPPRTEHNVVNTGKTRLRYAYIVAVAED